MLMVSIPAHQAGGEGSTPLHPHQLQEILLHQLRARLSMCWSRDTAFRKREWDKGKRSRGQCYPTALLVQDLLDGDILTGKVGEEYHYWNRLPDGTEVDFTSDQYGGDGIHPVTEGKKPRRRLNRKNERYVLLKRVYMWRFGWVK